MIDLVIQVFKSWAVFGVLNLSLSKRSYLQNLSKTKFYLQRIKLKGIFVHIKNWALTLVRARLSKRLRTCGYISKWRSKMETMQTRMEKDANSLVKIHKVNITMLHYKQEYTFRSSFNKSGYLSTLCTGLIRKDDKSQQRVCSLKK